MDALPNAFRAHATPTLNEKPKRTAYVFGAASPLGEALLNQVLGSPKYTQVFVMTTAPLPATIAHLQGISEEVFSFQNTDLTVDCFFTVHTQDPLSKAAYLPELGLRKHVYKPLEISELARLFSQVDRAASQLGSLSMQWCVVSRDESAQQLGQTIENYAAKTPCMVYGLAEGVRPQRDPTTFTPLGTHFLDKLGAGLLNTIARIASQMANPTSAVTLTNVKTAQRLVQHFDAMPQGSNHLQLLTQQDLI